MNDLYVDGSGNHDFQMVQDMETGLTRISANPNGTYGTAAYGESYMGWSGETDITWLLPVLKASDHSRPGLDWLLMTGTEYGKYQSTIAAALTARQAMWPLVQSAKASGINIDQPLTVYRDPASTAAQINAARTALLTLINDYAANASEAKPVDMSYLITNPGQGSENHTGWTKTGDWATNTSYYRNGEAVLQGRFTESWANGWNGETLANRSLTQQLSGLPEGQYQLALDIVATNQSTRAAVTGVTLTLGTVSVACSTTEDQPSTFTTPAFAVGADEKVGIGLAISATNASWVALDNFRLLYLGKGKTGDVNKDGIVSIADVTALVNIILGKDNGSTPLYDHVAADINKDGNVTIADVTALVNMILGK